ncbi:MAG: hypothetical protein J7L07_11060 [Candidatus Odinarchaeota archaeon]|nr:hypothetical protein [Candidatus Odinarchaeota archaeon]
MLYAAVRLGEMGEVINEIKEFTDDIVTLYTFRKIIRSKLEVVRDAPS